MRMWEVAMQIKQMSDTLGWSAVYVNEAPDKVGNPFRVVPLVCTALIADDTGETAVVGMIAEGPEFVPAPLPTFLGYLAPAQSVEDFLPILKEWEAEQVRDASPEHRELVARIRAAKASKGN